MTPDQHRVVQPARCEAFIQSRRTAGEDRRRRRTDAAAPGVRLPGRRRVCRLRVGVRRTRVAAIPQAGLPQLFQFRHLQALKSRDQFFAESKRGACGPDLQQVLAAYLGSRLCPVTQSQVALRDERCFLQKNAARREGQTVAFNRHRCLALKGQDQLPTVA